ncbi:hypothetical protein ACT4UT_37520, partial [Bacillus sp. B-TM1]
LTFVYVWAFSGVPLEGIKETAGEITKAIMTGVLNPDWAYVSLPDGEDLLHGLIDTLAIAILGTFISAFLSVPFAFWPAKEPGPTAFINKRAITNSGNVRTKLSTNFPVPEVNFPLLIFVAAQKANGTDKKAEINVPNIA